MHTYQFDILTSNGWNIVEFRASSDKQAFDRAWDMAYDVKSVRLLLVY